MGRSCHLFSRVAATVVWLFVIAGGVGVTTSSLDAQDGTTAARAVLGSLKSARQAVFAGVVVMDIRAYHEKADCVTHEVCRLYFDRAGGCMRCDRKVTAGPLGRSYECILVETLDEVVFYDSGVGVISRYPAGTRLTSLKAKAPMDPFVIGLGGPGAYEVRVSFEAFVDALLGFPVVAFAQEGSMAKLQLDAGGPDDVMRLFMTVDVTKGYTPISYSEVHLSHKGASVGREVCDAKTVWSVVNETYVPTEWEITFYGKRFVSVTLSWLSVNEEISTEVFAIGGIAAPKGATIINHKSGTQVIEGKVQ